MENDVIKLLGCPFCGKSPEVIITPYGEITSIYCTDCRVDMSYMSGTSILDRWNRRSFDAKECNKVLIPIYHVVKHIE